MAGSILVINPNSTQTVTDGIATALRPLILSRGPEIECVTLQTGPPAIESQRDTDSVILPLCETVQARVDVGAFVIACYSDPGLHAARESTRKPVFGIAECGMLSALTRGERFGVISILQTSIPRHLRYVRTLGLQQRFAGDLAIDLGVLELSDQERVLARMVDVAQRLQQEHGADVLVMGCAGMAGLRRSLEDAVAIPVIEPVQAAVTMALGAVCLRAGYA